MWTYDNQGGSPNFRAGVFATPISTGLVSRFGGPISVPQGPTALASGVFTLEGYPDVGVLSTLPARGSFVNFVAPPAFPALQALAGVPLLLPTPEVKHMAVGDFDRADGLSDVVIADSGVFGGALPALTFYNSAAPGFAIVLAAGTIPTFVVVADFDQNGWDDVAVSDGANNRVAVYYHLGGPGLFSPPVVLPLGAISPTSMDVADFNNDGFPDIVVVGNAGVAKAGFAQVFLNNVVPVSGFTALSVQPQSTWGTDARFVEAFEADGNGWIDFAVANFGSHTVTVFLTQPVGRVLLDPGGRVTRDIVCLEPWKLGIEVEAKFKYELQCGYYPTGIAAGDFDRNGKMDMAISLYSATLEIDPQVASCIEVIFDVACGFQPNQLPHRISPEFEPQVCEPCIDGPCAENSPPTTGIETDGDSKNP